jgi:hypothetical protein
MAAVATTPRRPLIFAIIALETESPGSVDNTLLLSTLVENGDSFKAWILDRNNRFKQRKPTILDIQLY